MKEKKEKSQKARVTFFDPCHQTDTAGLGKIQFTHPLILEKNFFPEVTAMKKL